MTGVSVMLTMVFLIIGLALFQRAAPNGHRPGHDGVTDGRNSERIKALHADGQSEHDARQPQCVV